MRKSVTFIIGNVDCVLNESAFFYHLAWKTKKEPIAFSVP